MHFITMWCSCAALLPVALCLGNQMHIWTFWSMVLFTILLKSPANMKSESEPRHTSAEGNTTRVASQMSFSPPLQIETHIIIFFKVMRQHTLTATWDLVQNLPNAFQTFLAQTITNPQNSTTRAHGASAALPKPSCHCQFRVTPI